MAQAAKLVRAKPFTSTLRLSLQAVESGVPVSTMSDFVSRLRRSAQGPLRHRHPGPHSQAPPRPPRVPHPGRVRQTSPPRPHLRPCRPRLRRHGTSPYMAAGTLGTLKNALLSPCSAANSVHAFVEEFLIQIDEGMFASRHMDLWRISNHHISRRRRRTPGPCALAPAAVRPSSISPRPLPGPSSILVHLEISRRPCRPATHFFASPCHRVCAFPRSPPEGRSVERG